MVGLDQKVNQNRSPQKWELLFQGQCQFFQKVKIIKNIYKKASNLKVFKKKPSIKFGILIQNTILL